MPWSSRIHEDIAVVEIVYSGVVTLHQMLEQADHNIELQKTRGLRNFLIDLERMDLPPDFSMADILELLNQAQDDGLERGIRVAMFASESSGAREALEFYENASVNRGWVVMACSGRGEALQWLLTDTEPNRP